MSNMDELLINAHLQERQPVSLPWNGKDERRSKADCNENDDELDTRLSRYNRTVSDHTLLHKSDTEEPSDCYVKYSSNIVHKSTNNEPRGYSEKYNKARIGRCDNVTNILFCNTDITFTVKKTAIPEQEDTDCFGNQSLGYKPSFSEDRLSSNDKRPSPFRYHNYYVDRKQTGNHFASFSATCTKVNNIQNKSRKSPRSSVKVSRQIIQESKLGYPLPTPPDKTKLENKDRTSRISNCLLNRENKKERKLENQVDTEIRTTRTKDEKTERVLARKSHQLEKNEKHLANKERTVSQNKTDAIKIGNRLDELLNMTEDAMKSPNIDHKTQTGDGTKGRNDIHVQKDASTMTNNSTNRTLNYRYNENRKKSIYRHMSLESKAEKDPKYEEKKYNVPYREMSKPHYNNEKDEKFDKLDEDIYDEYSEDLNKHKQKTENRETGENKDEILKFTCQMMDINQPKLMSKKRTCQKPNEGGKEGGIKIYENNLDVIDFEKVEELNKKSEELLRKIIRDRKKKRERKTVVINVDPECVRKKIQKREKNRAQVQIKGDTTDTRHDTPSIICETEEKKEDADDVFDISPAKNKETLTDDSELESSCVPKHNNDTDVGRNAKPREHSNLQTNNKAKVSKSYTIVSHDLKPKTTGKDTLVRFKSVLKGAKRKKKK